jgi:hypothetical protein
VFLSFVRDRRVTHGRSANASSEISEALREFTGRLRTLRPDVKKISSVRNWFIDIKASLKERQIPVNASHVKKMEKVLDVLLLREPVKKAKLLTDAQLLFLLSVNHPVHSVTLALMLPSGSRFADAAKVLPSDFLSLDESGKAHLRIFQAKNIRKRLNQRWLTQMIPRKLLPCLVARMLETLKSNVPLVSSTYNEFLAWLKKTLHDNGVSTYSIRRTVFERLRVRCRTIEEMVLTSMHFNKESFRWYLEAPLPDESALQEHATSWHTIHSSS